MARRIAAWALALAIGALVGGGATWWALPRFASAFQQHYGPWSYSPLAGSEAADPYTRALVARTGLLALSARETIYFQLNEDEHGRPLDESCVYELSGGRLPARWWSLTIYAPDNYLPRSGDHAFSVDATRVNVDANGDWSTRVSVVRGDATDWISSRAAQHGFTISLRLYQPLQEAREHPATIMLPEVRTISCPDGGA